MYKFMTLLPKDYCLIPGNGAIKLVRTGSEYICKLKHNYPKYYCLIPGKMHHKTCLWVSSTIALIKRYFIRVNHFLFGFDPVYCKCTDRTSSKLDLSPDIDPTEISRIFQSTTLTT